MRTIDNVSTHTFSKIQKKRIYISQYHCRRSKSSSKLSFLSNEITKIIYGKEMVKVQPTHDPHGKAGLLSQLLKYRIYSLYFDNLQIQPIERTQAIGKHNTKNIQLLY